MNPGSDIVLRDAVPEDRTIETAKLEFRFISA